MLKSKEKKGLKIVVLGPPGSGKGTQSKFLSEHFKVPAYAAGNLLRAEARKKTKRGQAIKKLIEAGKLAPHYITNSLIKEKVLGSRGGVIIDGYPRDLKQLRVFKKYFTPDAVIFLNVSPGEIMRRLGGRRICGKCGEIYHLIYKKPKKKDACDVCGGRLKRRADETSKAIRQRLSIFKKETLPVIEWYRKRGLLLEVDGDKSIKIVSQKVLEAFLCQNCL